MMPLVKVDYVCVYVITVVLYIAGILFATLHTRMCRPASSSTAKHLNSAFLGYCLLIGRHQ